MYLSKISIILPCYQAERFLPTILNDICRQTYTDWEVLCVSNGKLQQEQLCILEKWKEKDKRIRVISTPKEKGGVSYARNLGLDKATGEWICFVDADDRIIPNHLSLMADAVDNDTEVVYGGITQRAINEKGNNDNGNGNENETLTLRNTDATKTIIKSQKQNQKDNPRTLDTSSIVNALLDNDNVSAPYNVLIKKSLLKDLRFNERYTYGEDAVFKMHLFKKAKRVKLIPLTGYIYVRDANNASAVDRYHETMEGAINEKFELLGEILKKYGMDEQTVKKTVHQMYYDVALVPILTNPFHLKTTLSFKGKHKRTKSNFFENNLPAIVFKECNAETDSNPFYRVLRIGHKIHSCLFVTMVLELFYQYKYRKN